MDYDPDLANDSGVVLRDGIERFFRYYNENQNSLG
jgi:hypothetical protein